MAQSIDLSTPLTIRTAFLFPLQNSTARREVLLGAVLLLIPVVGWILNMGHRIQMVHNMQHGRNAWPAWHGPGRLFWFGLVTFIGMLEYHLPAIVAAALAWHWQSIGLGILAVLLWLLASIAVPGYMTHYCRSLDAIEVFNPFLALRRVFQGGLAYWRAWSIALTALLLSFSGLLVFGIGFLVTSVWFWQVAGYSFAAVMSQRFELTDDSEPS